MFNLLDPLGLFQGNHWERFQDDIDFARKMKAHHEQAVMMSQKYLQEGTDPQLRRLANQIIRDQEDEIKFLEDWLR